MYFNGQFLVNKHTGEVVRLKPQPGECWCWKCDAMIRRNGEEFSDSWESFGPIEVGGKIDPGYYSDNPQELDREFQRLQDIISTQRTTETP